MGYLQDAWNKYWYSNEFEATRVISMDLAIREADEEIERLRVALKPFAEQAESFDSDGKEFVPDGFSPAFADHTIGDLRRARAALNGGKP